ncbi:hypothetical protein C4K38_3221 [Pseudomonas chlororaphis subsp. piscium]|nr:hypothetical protein C4K38_3221 [Pseudomonas chlororaphis subsp. piscium]
MCRLALLCFFGQSCAGAMVRKPWRRGLEPVSGSGGAIDRGMVSAGKNAVPWASTWSGGRCWM